MTETRSISDKSKRELGLQDGGLLVVVGILQNDTEDKERGYDLREKELDQVVWNEKCGLQVLTTPAGQPSRPARLTKDFAYGSDVQ